jgi:hypothetical protein
LSFGLRVYSFDACEALGLSDIDRAWRRAVDYLKRLKER